MSYFFGGGVDDAEDFTGAGEAPFVIPPRLPCSFDMIYPSFSESASADIASSDSASGKSDLRARIAAFLGIYGHPREAEIDLWEAALRSAPGDLTEALGIWLRCSNRKPKPFDILRLMQVQGEPASMRRIALDVALGHRISVKSLTGRSRCPDLAHPRQEAMFRMRQAGFSLSQIGRFFRRDHTTVMHGVRAHEARQATTANSVYSSTTEEA